MSYLFIFSINKKIWKQKKKELFSKIIFTLLIYDLGFGLWSGRDEVQVVQALVCDHTRRHYKVEVWNSRCLEVKLKQISSSDRSGLDLVWDIWGFGKD